MLDSICGGWEMEISIKATSLCNSNVRYDISTRDNLSMRKKILIITPFNPDGVGGAETFARNMIKEASINFNVTVITLPPVTGWDNTSMRRGILIGFKLFFKAICLKNREYDAIHCFGVIATGVGVMLKALSSAKIISTILAIYEFEKYPYWKRAIISWIFRRIDKVFVEDNIERRDMEKGLNIPSHKVINFMHWVDLDRFYPARTPIKKDRFNVLFIGRPIHKKGKHVIEQAEYLLKKDFDINFFYVESLPYDQLPACYQMADIFVIPSLYQEGVTFVVLEAAASGCAIISSNNGSLTELVSPFGIVIEPTAENFKWKIIKLYRKRSRLKQNKQRAYDYARKYFSRKNAEVFLKEY